MLSVTCFLTAGIWRVTGSERRDGVVGPALQGVQLHRHVVEPLALGLGEDDFLVGHHAHRLGLQRLAVDDERDVVEAGQHVWTRARTAAAEAAEAAAATAAARRRRRSRRRRDSARLLASGRPARRLLAPAGGAAWRVAAPPWRPGVAPRSGAGTGCTRRSQHADWMPGFVLFASTGPEISRTSRPAASVMRSFTSPTCFLLNHESTAACGGFSPKKVWSPQNS